MKIKKRVLSFVTALATVGSMLTCVPVMNEQLGYDTSTVSAAEAGSDNTGGNGGTTGDATTITNGTSTGQSRMGLLIYPIILPETDNGTVEPADFEGVDGHDRWNYVAAFGTFLEVDNNGKLIEFKDAVKQILFNTRGRVVNYTESEGLYITGGNAFDNTLRAAFDNSNFYSGNYNDISTPLNNAIKDSKDVFFRDWCIKVGIIDAAGTVLRSDMHATITDAILDGRFLWGVEILAEVKEAGASTYMMPLSDMCTYRASTAGITLADNERRKAMTIASKLESFGGSDESSPCWAFTWYLNNDDKTNYGALGCLRPNTNNGEWNGKGDGYGGWGIITVNGDDLDIGTTNIQIIETATLYAGKMTNKDAGYTGAYMGINRNDLINYNETEVNKLEKEEYAQNGVVANFINRVSSPWDLRNGRRYSLTYKDNNTADTKDTGAYPWSMLATTPVDNTEFKLDKDSIRYKAVLSDGSAETDWLPLHDLSNGALGVDANNKSLVITTEGDYKGKTITEAAKEADRDVFYIANAVYVYEGLSDGSFKGVKIPENKLIQRSDSLLTYINLTNGYWKNSTVGSLYGQYSDVGIPKFDVGGNNFFASTDGLDNVDASSEKKNTYFIASTVDYTESNDKDTNIYKYYTGAQITLKPEESISNLKGFIKATGTKYYNGDTTEMIDCGSSVSTGYSSPTYNDKETTRYRFNETGTDGKTLVARNGLDDNINVAGFSKFTFDDGSKAFVASYDYLEGNIPASRKVPDNNGYNHASGDMGFVRATSNYATEASPTLEFKKTSLSIAGAALTEKGKPTQTDAGCYLGMSQSEGNAHMSKQTISGVYKKASVDTKLKANATGYIDRGSSWSDSTNSMTDKGFTTTSSSTFKFYPEVEMQYDTLTDTDKSIYVVGDGIKEVKPLIYSTFGVDTGTTKIDSTAIAVDKRAKALAKKVATDETPVYLPGGILSGTTQDMKLTVNSYVLDLDVTTATNNAWGNTAYNPANDVKAAIEDKVSKVGITQKLVVKDNDTEKGTFGISDGSEEVEVKEIGTPTKRKDYYFFVKDGDITLKGISTYTGEAGSLSETKISNDEGLSAELDDFNKIVEQLKVQDVIDTVLAQNQGTGAWYTEDTSVLKISMYETAVSLPGIAFSDKLPLDAGPETADKKDDQYNKGYKAYITAGIKIKDADDNEYVLGESEATGDPSFVIPNVTVVDVAQ